MSESELARLTGALGSDDAAERARAAEDLCHMGADAKPAAAALVRAAGDGDEQVAQWAASALEALGPPTTQAMPTLVALLDKEIADVSYWAATLLARLGTAAAPAVDALAGVILAHPDIAARERATWAVGKIGTPAGGPARDALREAAASGSGRLARLATEALETHRAG